MGMVLNLKINLESLVILILGLQIQECEIFISV